MLELTDNEDEAIELLRAIARNTGSIESGDTIVNQGDRVVNQDVDLTRPSDENQPANWYTTGPAPIGLSAGDNSWERLEFGFRARAVNIRHTGPVEFCPTNPHRNGVPTYLPDPAGTWGSYEVGGSPPLRAAFVWVRADESATEDVGVLVEAY